MLIRKRAIRLIGDFKNAVVPFIVIKILLNFVSFILPLDGGG
ncbi:MAG: hypothetical protein ABIL70_08020 [candidate division WOR-3 bacterium]